MTRDRSTLVYFLSAKISSRLKMLQKLPAPALNRASAFAAARASPLRTTQRLSLVGTSSLSAFGVRLLMFMASKPDSRPPRPGPPTHSRSVKSQKCIAHIYSTALQSLVYSRATLASATLAAAGSIAWYTHLYGTVPFIGEVHASSPGEVGLHPAAYPWSNKGWLDSFDHAR